jgi:large subunit ribosomal protein L15
MMIHEITEKVGRYKQRKRIGRGESSGWGKTSGRGHKGAGQRAGNSYRAYFEGGQMPFARRIPKRGFSNAAFRTEYHIVNLKTLESRLDDGETVTVETLANAGIVRDAKWPLKVLGEGELTKKLHVTAAKFSKSARAKIEAAGGDITELPRTKWTRNGVVTVKPKKTRAVAPRKPAAVAQDTNEGGSDKA